LTCKKGTLQLLHSFAKVCKIKKPPTDTRGYDHAVICRTNQCGKYNAKNDTCTAITDKGKAGAISWLYQNPDAKCPNNPPMWDEDNGTADPVAARPD